MTFAIPSSEVYGFDPFARVPAYVDVNKGLVAIVNGLLPGGFNGKNIADLACGPASMTLLCLQMGTPESVTFVDMSEKALELAEKEVAHYKDRVKFSYIKADLEKPFNLPQLVDVAILGNSIHMPTDKLAVVKSITEWLEPSGLLAVNTTFYDGCYQADSEGHWMRWTLRTRRLIARAYKDGIEQGNPPVSSDKAPPARDFLTPGQYHDIFNSCGLTVVADKEELVNLDKEALKAIANYDRFVKGALRIEDGVDIGKKYLQHAIDIVLQDLKIEYFQRNWRQMVAQKA